MKVGITGASGFIGAEVCRTMQRGEHAIAYLSLDGPKPAVALENVHAVVHLAAIAHRRASAEELEAVNVRLAERVAREAAAAGAHFVFISSAKVHGETSEAPLRESSPIAPENTYAASKARAEERLRAIPGLSLAILRPPLVYGPGV